MRILICGGQSGRLSENEGTIFVRLTVTGLLIAAVMLWTCPLWAAGNLRQWTAFLQGDGLAHNVVSGGVQARDGTFWFATMGSGISRYDGQNWRTFTVDDGLPSNIVGGIYETADGTLWASAAGGFLRDSRQKVARWNGARWETVPMPEDLGDLRIQQIGALKDKGVCLATQGGGILHYDGSAWHAMGTEGGLASDDVQCILRTREGSVWVAYGSGRGFGFGMGRRRPDSNRTGMVSQFDPASGEWTQFAEADASPSGAVTAMTEAGDGAVWFGTWNGGVSRYDGRNWRTFSDLEGLPSNRVQAVTSAPDGSVWVGTQAGVARYLSQGAGTWEVFTEEDGLPNNFVTSMWTAQDGAVWVGTRGGVARYGMTGWVHHRSWAGQKDRGGVVMTRDPTGNVWAATGERIYRLVGARWEAVHRFDGERGRAVDLRVGPDGVLWAATSGEVCYLSGEGWRKLAGPESDRRSPISSICPARDGGLWLGTRRGAYRYDGVAWAPHAIEGADGVMAVREAADGAMWFGVMDGVIREADGLQRHFTHADGLSAGPVVEIALDRRGGEVWVSTLLEEVARYAGERWEPVPGNRETTFNGIRRIFQADDGTFWLASFVDGVIHTDGMSWTRYSTRSGLPGNQVRDICQDAQGRFWFATDRGLACYDPDGSAPETTLVAPPAQIAPYQSVLFRFAGQDAWKRTPTQALLYSWRLDRGAWSAFSLENRVLLNDLTADAHTFEVRAMDQEFNMEPTPALHGFNVMAPVWQQPWFLALLAISAVALAVSSGYALHRHRRWRAAQARLIEELDSELRMAHDMQMGLLPKAPLRETRFEIAGRCVPANHVGGDYFNYFWLDAEEQVLGFGAADVSGKAMPAAVRVMQLSGIFRYEFRSGRPLPEALLGLDRVLREHLEPTSFVTGCLGTLDVREGRVQLGNAAHPFPYHYSAKSGRLQALEMPSLPLGMTLPPGVSGNHAYEAFKVAPGDLLVLYSDGVTDLQDVNETFYEEERLERVILANAEAGAEALVNAILRDLMRFKGGASQVDDVTLLVLRMCPESRQGGIG